MNTLKKFFIAAIIVSGFSFISCSKEKDMVNEEMLSENAEVFLKSSDFGFNLSAQDSLCFKKFPLEDLNQIEIDALNQIREEEFLARDIYLQAYEMYEYRIFEQIAKSEEKHADAVKSLLEKYGMADPAENHEVGVFTSSEIQTLHDQLLSQVMLSGIDALKAGATIEDLDIFDLKYLLTNGIDNEDITFVFGNLLKGSENHLRAFMRVLASQGETYAPQYISQEEFDEIISTLGNGKNGKQNKNGQGNKSGKGKRNGKLFHVFANSVTNSSCVLIKYFNVYLYSSSSGISPIIFAIFISFLC